MKVMDLPNQKTASSFMQEVPGKQLGIYWERFCPAEPPKVSPKAE